MSRKNIVIAFDLYGTLLSTESIAKKLEELYGKDKAPKIAAEARKYQLEYTWRLNSMQKFEPFSALTRRSFQHVLHESFSITPTADDLEALMSAYDSLSTFPDVKETLEHVRSSSKVTITAVVFSNGTRSMVSNSVQHSPGLSAYASMFKELVLTEDVQLYKPHPKVYHHLAEKMGKSNEQMSEMWLVSGNPFDIVGARAVGMQAAWVDRAGNGWADGLVEGEAGSPTVVLRSLTDLVKEVEHRSA